MEKLKLNTCSEIKIKKKIRKCRDIKICEFTDNGRFAKLNIIYVALIPGKVFFEQAEKSKAKILRSMKEGC